jgi:ADP-ribosylglycohydrolase
MDHIAIQDRAAGALMGAFIGDALGLGPHWYYDLDELRHDYGDWIDGYTDPRPGRYHDGLKAGELSQAGFILRLTLSSLVDRGGYDEADFCRRMDRELFPLLAGIGAAATRIVLPVSVFAFFVRKSIVQGLTMGVLKD